MSEIYNADQIMTILMSVRKIQDLLSMLKECYFAGDNHDQFPDWFMTVSNVTEPLFPDIIDFLFYAQANAPDHVKKASEPEQEKAE
jgi:hypothetical protein